MTIADISKLSISERLQTMEAIWDSLVHESTKIEPPEWHKQILSVRREKIDNGNAEFISIEDLKSKNDR